MSEAMMDERPRLRDIMRPAGLNSAGCLKLAETILAEQGAALMDATRKCVSAPTKENKHHLETLINFYKSEWFDALSCGAIDGETAVKRLMEKALEGRKEGRIT